MMMSSNRISLAVFLVMTALLASVESMPNVYQLQAKCKHFVAPSGPHGSGTRESPFTRVPCVFDPVCNAKLLSRDVVCFLPGTYMLDETVFIKLAPESSLTIIPAEAERSVTLDGQNKTTILNTLQTSTLIIGFVFQYGFGSGGGAVYGERTMSFYNCRFYRNTASVHGGAVLGGQKLEFTLCEFRDNSARFAGAVRVSDKGSADFKNCKFIGNYAEGKGGAIVTQIEDPRLEVTLDQVLFCFNSSPESDNIYNFRDTTHSCATCQFNSVQCCSGNGRVVSIGGDYPVNYPLDSKRHRMCLCRDGFTGEHCDRTVVEHDDL